jgi:hypothetical protein
MILQFDPPPNFILAELKFSPSIQSLYRPSRDISQAVNTSVLHKSIMTEIDIVEKLPENWDGYGSAAPNPNAVESAKLLIGLNPQLFQSDFRPEISADGEGRVIIEWYHQPKTLVLFVDARETIVIQSWGPNDKTEDSSLNSQDELPKLWDWLFRR